MNKTIFSSYASVETALLNDLATEAKNKGKKARTLKGERYYVEFDGVWYEVTPEQCRIRKLIRNNFNMFVEQFNSAKSDILGVWKNVWGDRLPAIIADLEKAIEICEKYFDAFKAYITKSGEEDGVEENVEENGEETEVSGENVTEEVTVDTVNKESTSAVVEYELIDGFEDYMVSSDGKVFSLNYRHTRKMKELKSTPNKKGYLVVNLCANGQMVQKLVHRLVAEAFIANPDNLPEVNHKDEVKTNNCVENLEWCTGVYNINYGTRSERSAKARTNHKTLSTPVVCLETGEVYPSVHEAERQTGVDQSYISKCLNGKYKTTGGFHWEKFVVSDNPVYD